MPAGIPTAQSIARKVPKFLKSGKPATITNIQEFLSAEYGAGMRQESKRYGVGTGDLGRAWERWTDWFMDALKARGIAITDE